ncbi:MAG: efflux RND transporter periplasmic adaptor subunit [Chitinophagaceae bacterium]
MKLKFQTGALMVLYILVSSCSNSINNQEIPTYKVIQLKVENTIFQNSYVAEVNAIENIDIRSRIEGVIEKILVDEGDFVSAGQVLIKIESRNFEQELKRAEAILASRVADFKAAQIEIENAKRLLSKNIISKTELELLDAKLNSAKANVDEAKGNVSLCELNLSYTKIKAPFSGRINRILLKRGSIANQESLITTLSNDHEVFAYFNLNESDYLQLTQSPEYKKRTEVQLQLSDGSYYDQTGIIETAETEVDRNTGNIALRARFKNKNGILKHGSSARVIWSKTGQNTMLIPKESTFEVQELIYVYVVDDNGIVKQRSLKVSGQLPLYYAIESGLNKDEWILLEGIQMVRNNDKIKANRVQFPIYNQ